MALENRREKEARKIDVAVGRKAIESITDLRGRKADIRDQSHRQSSSEAQQEEDAWGERNALVVHRVGSNVNVQVYTPEVVEVWRSSCWSSSMIGQYCVPGLSIDFGVHAQHDVSATVTPPARPTPTDIFLVQKRQREGERDRKRTVIQPVLEAHANLCVLVRRDRQPRLPVQTLLRQVDISVLRAVDDFYVYTLVRAG